MKLDAKRTGIFIFTPFSVREFLGFEKIRRNIYTRRIFRVEEHKKMCQKYQVGRRKARARIVFSRTQARSEQCRRAATLYNFMHFPLLLDGGLGE